MSGTVNYRTDDNVIARGPSPRIWADCPVITFLRDPGAGIHWFDDFQNSAVMKETANSTDFTSGVGHIYGDINWYCYIKSSKLVDCALQADDIGVLMLDTDGTDDDVNVITSGENLIGTFRMPKVGETKNFWFEVRLKVNTITNTDLSWFVGMMQPGQAADGTPLGAAPTAPASTDHVGFFVAEADGNDITIIYEEAGAGTAQSTTGLITPVADTYIRLGFRTVFKGKSSEIRFYADGADLGDAVAVDISGTNANWPGDTNMDIVIAMTSGATGANGDNLKIDWVRCAQEY